jgi:2-oxoisovalerate dehydrogenase E2 component (dihydrolipoyl transacylase)
MGIRVVKLPDVGEGVAEAEIVEWHVVVGDEVVEDQILAAVMTDKATVEIPSPSRGRIAEIGPDVGSLLAVGGKLVAIETDGAASLEEMPDAIEQAPVELAAVAPTSRPMPASVEQVVATKAPLAAPKQIVGGKKQNRDRNVPIRRSPDEKPLASPAVRARALSLGIDLRMIRGSGPAARISHQDIDKLLNHDAAAPPSPGRSGYEPREGFEEIRITGLRRKIAERMAHSTRRIAHFSYIEEIDLTAIENLRALLNTRHAGPKAKLTILPFILRALVLAVRDYPQMNAHYDDEREIVTRHFAVHAGIATQTGNGLMVPVLAHAESCDLWQSAQEIQRIAAAARDGSARREELSGSTITITSLGELGGIATTPVINAPEVAIIGINRAALRPMWQDSQFVPRKMMNLSSSFDHRVIDGQDAALFIRRIKELLEQPATLFIES